jgi:hypothetical protein
MKEKKKVEKTKAGKSKVGKPVDNIFGKGPAKTEPVAAKPQDTPSEKKEYVEDSRARGRPQEHKEEWSKVTVVLLEKQINWLDTLAVKIRQNTKAKVSRAEIIRAAVGAMEACGIAFTNCASEEDLKLAWLEKQRG